MKQVLVLIVIALVSAAIVWSWFDPAVAPAVVGPGDDPDATGAASAASTSGVDADVPAAARLPGSARDLAASDEQPPIPHDADWIELRVVARESGLALAGAEVRWCDNSCWRTVALQRLAPEVRYAIGVDTEQRARWLGWSTRSDERGIARVHRAGGTEVTARFGDLYGYCELEPEHVEPPGGFVLELTRDVGIDVQVLDADGRPAGGVTVGLGAFDEAGAFLGDAHGECHAMTRASDGIARIAHTARLVEPSPADARSSFRVFADLPGYVGRGVAVDPHDPPPSPVVLRLPPTGALELRLAVAGELRKPGAWFVAAVDAATGQRTEGNAVRRPDAEGRTRFDHVALGNTFAVSSWFDGSQVSGTVVGPIEAGTTVTATISPSPDRVVLSGRLLHPDGRSIAERRFRFELNGAHRHDERHRCDEDGRFVIVLRPRAARSDVDDEGGMARATASLEVEHRPLFATVEFGRLGPGEHDLGDFVMALEPPLVSGRCFVDGKPAKVDNLSIVEFVVDTSGRKSFRDYLLHGLATHEDGSFSFRGRADCEHLAIRAHGSYLPIEPVSFAPGATGVVVSLRKATRLIATVRLPGSNAEMFQAWLVRTDAADPHAEANGRWGDLDHQGERRRQFSWHALPAGTYDLKLCLAGYDEPLRVVRDVRVPLPEGGDPRLIDIDLRALVRVQELRLFDQQGRQVPGHSAHVVPAERIGDDDFRAVSIDGDRVRLLLPRRDGERPGGIELFVCAKGYRPARVACAGAPVEVRLDEWPRTRIQIVHGVTLPDGAWLEASLLWPDREVELDGVRVGRRLRSCFVQRSRGVRVENGCCEIAIDDYPSRLQLHVRHRNGFSFVSWASPPIHIGEPRSVLQVDSAALQAAIRAATR